MKVGFGRRHPDLLEFLRCHEAAAVEHVAWLNGTLPLQMAAYPTTVAELPDSLVTSVRCIVAVRDCVIVCHNPDGAHIWPGGQRQLGESFEDTAGREVYEETGWRLRQSCQELLGFLHFRHCEPQPADYPYPHPDFLNAVFRAAATSRAVPEDAEWVDHGGWELRSELVAVADARRLRLSPVQHAFLDAFVEPAVQD